MLPIIASALSPESVCQACGACCSYSATWPRFSLESDAQLEAIPPLYVAADHSGMRCAGERCSALSGEVGKATVCLIYEIRPHVCGACMPGGEDCRMARERFGLAPWTNDAAADLPNSERDIWNESGATLWER